MLISLMNNEKFPWKSIFLLGFKKKTKKIFKEKRETFFVIFKALDGFEFSRKGTAFRKGMALNFPVFGFFITLKL